MDFAMRIYFARDDLMDATSMDVILSASFFKPSSRPAGKKFGFLDHFDLKRILPEISKLLEAYLQAILDAEYLSCYDLIAK